MVTDLSFFLVFCLVPTLYGPSESKLNRKYLVTFTISLSNLCFRKTINHKLQRIRYHAPGNTKFSHSIFVCSTLHIEAMDHTTESFSFANGLCVCASVYIGMHVCLYMCVDRSVITIKSGITLNRQRSIKYTDMAQKRMSWDRVTKLK